MKQTVTVYDLPIWVNNPWSHILPPTITVRRGEVFGEERIAFVADNPVRHVDWAADEELTDDNLNAILTNLGKSVN